MLRSKLVDLFPRKTRRVVRVDHRGHLRGLLFRELEGGEGFACVAVLGQQWWASTHVGVDGTVRDAPGRPHPASLAKSRC